jgi:hypothetical protein
LIEDSETSSPLSQSLPSAPNKEASPATATEITTIFQEERNSNEYGEVQIPPAMIRKRNKKKSINLKNSTPIKNVVESKFKSTKENLNEEGIKNIKNPRFSGLINKYAIGELEVPVWRINIPKSEDAVRMIDTSHVEKIRNDILNGGIKLNNESGVLLLKNGGGK